MKAKQKISSLHLVPATDPAPVKALLSAEEKQFLDLLATAFVRQLLTATEGNTFTTQQQPTLQP